MERSDISVWLVGLLLAGLLVFADVALDDAGVTLILASMFPMALGIWRRERAWRWALLCVVPLMVERLALARLHAEHWQGTGYAVASILPAICGAYLGALCRRSVEALWQEKE